MAKDDKLVLGKKSPSKQPVERENLTSEAVTDLNFFKEDLDALDHEVASSEDLYNEVHQLYSQLTGGPYVPTRNIRDIAEVAKTLVSARTSKIDVINKRIALKKTINDLNYRNNGGIDENGEEAVQMQARKIVEIIRQEQLEARKNGGNNFTNPQQSFDKRTQAGKQRALEEKELERTINEKLNSGEIKMGKNDHLVGTNDYVVSRYDRSTNTFVAVDSRNGKVIEDFPKERLPSGKITRVSNNEATMLDGSTVKLFDKMEFDDNYEDNAP